MHLVRSNIKQFSTAWCHPWCLDYDATSWKLPADVSIACRHCNTSDCC